MRAEVCACRRWIRPESPDPADIEAAVRQHQQTEAHQGWRAMGGMVARTAVPWSRFPEPVYPRLRRVDDLRLGR